MARSQKVHLDSDFGPWSPVGQYRSQLLCGVHSKCRSITSSSDSSTFWLYKDISLWPLSSHKIYILFSIQNYIYYFIEMCCYRNCSKLEKANTVVFFWTRTKYHEWKKKNLGKSYYFGRRRQNIMHTEKLANSGEWTY